MTPTDVEPGPLPAAADLEKPTVQRLRSELLHAQSLPSAPHVLSRLLELTDGDGDIAELVSLIESDPGVTARILRTANSPFFGQARNVTSVASGVVVLGVAMVRNLALGLTAWNAAGWQVPAGAVARLWEHSLATGLAAQALAARSGVCDPSDAFTAGLLHDVGRLVLARRFPEDYAPLLLHTAAEPCITALERAEFGCDHAEVGAWLFDAWRVPKPLVEAIAQHHDPSPTQGVAALVAAANALVHHAEPNGANLDPGRDAALDRAAAAGITPELWLQVADRSRGGGSSR